MKKSLALISAALSVSTMIAVVPAAHAQERLTVVSNGGPIQRAAQGAFYAPFSAATGVQIIEDSWSQEYARLRSQADTGNIIWDVVEITYNNLVLACEEGILEEIDWSLYVDPADFEGAGGLHPCGIPMTTVVNGIVYDGAVFENGPRTWQDFWDVETWPGRRALLSRPTVLVFALMADGVPTDQVLEVLSGPGGVERAFTKLDEIKEHIRWWRTGAEPLEMLASGEVAMAQAWNGRVATAIHNEGRDFRMSYEGGVTGGNQYIAIMRGTQNLDRAIEFVQFSASAEPLAQYVTELLSMPANASAAALLSEDLQATVPNPDQMAAAFLQMGEAYDEFWMANLDALTQSLAIWQAQ